MTNSKILARFFPLKSAAIEPDAAFQTASFGFVRQAIDEEKRIFKAIYENHHRPVYRLFLRMTQNTEVAEDLTQEVFVKLFKNFKNVRADSELNRQILYLAIDELLLYLISEDQRFNQTAIAKFNRNSNYKFGAQTTKSNFDRQAMENAIARLPIDYRLIFLLHDFEHLTHREIARILKIDVATSKLNLHEARHKLRRRLTE